jgi:photosystem I subunit 3
MSKKMKLFSNNFIFSVVLSLNLFLPSQAKAIETGVLVDCDKSPGFEKRLKASVTKLEGRLSKYQPGTPPAIALEQQITQTKTRFDKYGKSGLMCGKDGLPHLITDGDFKHAPEFMIPGVMFLYITGWIGWAGRKYLSTVSQTANPTEKEIIIDVPVALKIMSSGYLWPISSWREFIDNKFIASKNEITVSPR